MVLTCFALPDTTGLARLRGMPVLAPNYLNCYWLSSTNFVISNPLFLRTLSNSSNADWILNQKNFSKKPINRDSDYHYRPFFALEKSPVRQIKSCFLN